MNAAFWHEATNHIPVIGMPFAALLLLGGLIRGSRDVIRASFMALVIIALTTIFVDKTGGPAARIVRNYPGVERADIHEHAEAADYGLLTSEIAGGLALIGLWLYRKESSSTRFTWLVCLAALFSCSTLVRVAHLGGLIRHPEIRTGAAAPPSAADVPHP